MDATERQILENARADANNAARIASEVKNWLVDPNHGILKQLGDIRSALIGGNPDGLNNFHWLEEQVDQHVTELASSVAAASGGVDTDALVERISTGIATRLQS